MKPAHLKRNGEGISEDTGNEGCDQEIVANGAHHTTQETVAQDKELTDFTKEEHRDFVEAILEVGIKSCSPTVIIDLMRNRRGLRITREIMKSHLQKYRKIKDSGKAQFMKEYDSFLRMVEEKEAKESEMVNPDKVLQETLAGEKVRDVVGGDAAALLTYTVSKDFDLNSLSTLNGDEIEFPVLNETEKETKLGKSLSCVKELLGLMGEHIQQSRQGQPTDTAKISQLHSILAENEERMKRDNEAKKGSVALPKPPPLRGIRQPRGYETHRRYYPQNAASVDGYASNSLAWPPCSVSSPNPHYRPFPQPHLPPLMFQEKSHEQSYYPAIAPRPLYQYHGSPCLPRMHHTYYQGQIIPYGHSAMVPNSTLEPSSQLSTIDPSYIPSSRAPPSEHAEIQKQTESPLKVTVHPRLTEKPRLPSPNAFRHFTPPENQEIHQERSDSPLKVTVHPTFTKTARLPSPTAYTIFNHHPDDPETQKHSSAVSYPFKVTLQPTHTRLPSPDAYTHLTNNKHHHPPSGIQKRNSESPFKVTLHSTTLTEKARLPSPTAYAHLNDHHDDDADDEPPDLEVPFDRISEANSRSVSPVNRDMFHDHQVLEPSHDVWLLSRPHKRPLPYPDYLVSHEDHDSPKKLKW
eukprot:scaffold9646_cov133-Cylindrotheca_fusiformis.AAC.11